MRLPTPLLRRKKNVNKYDFGHVLVLAGSGNMLGAGALVALAALRSGAGLVTAAVPKSLNSALQRKIANVIMTLPLAETKEQTFSSKAFVKIKKTFPKFEAIAIGPGMTTNKSTQELIIKIVETSPVPIVLDADALNTIAQNTKALNKTKTPKILTPHFWEMARLTKLKESFIEKNNKKVAGDFARKFNCILLLKGSRTVVASKNQIYINKTGNPGMATAGSGDVLTGIIAGLIAQGLEPFSAAKFGAFIHGLAGDKAAKVKSRAGLIASDIIEHIPSAIKACA